jgi:hypothetical protein
MKLYQAVQKLLVGDLQTDSHFGMVKVILMPLKQYKISYKSTNPLKSCIHLRSLNVCHYGTVEATRLKNMASRPPSVSSPPYIISSKSTTLFKSCTTSEV